MIHAEVVLAAANDNILLRESRQKLDEMIPGFLGMDLSTKSVVGKTLSKCLFDDINSERNSIDALR